jgi:hypothetical protein
MVTAVLPTRSRRLLRPAAATGLSAEELAILEGLLDRLASNVGEDEEGGAPWAGVVEQRRGT